jgi:hypothetical protein
MHLEIRANLLRKSATDACFMIYFVSQKIEQTKFMNNLRTPESSWVWLTSLRLLKDLERGAAPVSDPHFVYGDTSGQ